MSLSLTRDELAAMDPCDPDKRMALFGRRKSMTAKQALAAGASIRDLLWVAARMGRRDLCVKFALACAVRAEKYTKDPRVKACNDATQVWLDAPTDANMKLLRIARSAAAYAADAAAYAYAADAAAYAYAAADAAAYAYAADAAAAAYAYAAADAAAAAYAYAYAAADARKKEEAAQRKIFLQIFG